MRPIKLIMSGFMPYAEMEEIDFRDFGENGLYLITGDTGAGKTSIFDAICFALYGKASGNVRDDSMFRSLYAKAETPTYVELSFEHDGREYYIKRNPAYIRPKISGEGTTEEHPKACLTLPDGSLIDRREDVNKKIEEILGVDIKQFSQISMIAQGDFLKLILDGTKVRRENFRHIFNTEIYQTLQENLKKEKLQIETKYKDGKKSVQQYIAGIECQEEDILFVDVEKAKADGLNTQTVLEVIDKVIASDRAKLQDYEQRLALIDKELATANSKYGKAQEYEEMKKSLERLKASLDDRRLKFEGFKQVLENAKKNFEGKDAISKKITTIDLQLDDYERLDQLIKIINLKSAEYEKKEKDIISLSKFIESKSKKLEEFEAEMITLKDAGANKVMLENDLLRAQENKESLESLKKEIELYNRKCTDEKGKETAFIKTDQIYKSCRDKYNEMDDIFRGAQAGILALRLEDKKPCPVCGSTSHPSKAKLIDNCPSQEEVDEAKVKADEARANMDAAKNNLAVARSSTKTYGEELVKKAEKLVGISSLVELNDRIDGLIEKAGVSFDEIKNRLSIEKDKEKRKAEIESLIPELRNDVKSANDKETSIKEELASLKSEIAANIKQKDIVKENLEYENYGKANEVKNALMRKCDNITKAFNDAEKKYNDEKEGIISLEGDIKGKSETIKKAIAFDIEEIISEIEDIKRRKNDCQRTITQISGFIANNQKCKDNIETKAKELVEIEDKLTQIAILSDTANGSITGKMKLTLEAFIQATYFDRIIRKANRRLMEMSGYKYELYRIQDSSNLQSNSGLELGVIDHYNGTKRSVKSLSGGESFMASLSLALGLSDEVSESAGGIKVDTMFIDEGFGSLDQETLQSAFKALSKLSDRSGRRLVGIISHVSELKERIDKQIVVTKEKTGGSHTKLIL